MGSSKLALDCRVDLGKVDRIPSFRADMVICEISGTKLILDNER